MKNCALICETMEEEIKLRETLSVVQAAAALGLSNTSVYRLIYDQKVKVLKGFGRLRIPRTELDKLFAERAQGSTLAADELTRKIDSAATEMAKTLQESGADIPVMDRVNAKNFAAALRYEANVRPVSGEKQPAAATK